MKAVSAVLPFRTNEYVVENLIRWENVPEGTRQLALICDDPDAPTPQPWVHWVIYAMPGDVLFLLILHFRRM